MCHLLLPLLWLGPQHPAAAQDSSLSPRWQEIRQEYADKALLEKFYTAFQKGDGAAMAARLRP